MIPVSRGLSVGFHRVVPLQNQRVLAAWTGAMAASYAEAFMTTARIYKPAKTAMQSGTAATKLWVLDFEPAEPKEVEPLMGWTSSGDMQQQVRLRFASKEEAMAYCEQHGIPYRVSGAKEPKRQAIAYADNFAYSRRTPWTH
jgi:hypothetical protein